MGVFDLLSGGASYRKCQQNEDGSVDCISYKPTKDGKKIVTATIKAQLSSDCKATVTDSDGDPKRVAELEEYLGKHIRTKCNQPGAM